MHARSVVGGVRFARSSGLLLSCITSESILPNTDATFHQKCRTFYAGIVGHRVKGPVSCQIRTSPSFVECNHITSPASPHISSFNILCSQHSRKYGNKFTECQRGRNIFEERFQPVANVFISRDKSTNSHKRQKSSDTILQYKNANTKKAKKKIAKAQKRMKERYDKIEEKVRLKAEEIEDRVKEMRENIFTVPNLLTTGRIALSPLLGYLVVNEHFLPATLLFAAAGITDMLDGYIARNFANQQSVLGSILDPLADKVLVGVLTITLTMVGLIPVPLTVVIVARDVLLLGAAFVLRYKSLPSPVTLRRYFDLTYATVKLKPLLISKVNTNVQLIMVAASLAAPVFSYVDHPYLHALWYLTAGTTVVSGLTYIFAKDTFKILSKRK